MCRSFHEKAGRSQDGSVFTSLDSWPLSWAASVAILPSAVFVERLSLAARWVFSFSRCCYLIIDLSAHLFGESWAPGLSRSHLDSAVELSCSDRNSRPRRASLFGYCAMVRTPLRPPTTDAAVRPAFESRQLPLVSWHFFLLALQALIPISADHCLLQMVPGCSALPAPSSFA